MVMPSPAEGRPALATALPPQRGRCPGREAPSPPRARAALTPQAARRLRGTRKEAPTDSLHDSVLSDNYLDSSRARGLRSRAAPARARDRRAWSAAGELRAV